jgi:ATP-binding protein involved in chromosome partitioning
LIDADIYGFSVPDMMGITVRPTVEGEKLLPVERFGVKVSVYIERHITRAGRQIENDIVNLSPVNLMEEVIQPHPTAAFVAARAGSMAIKTDHEVVGVIENMAYYESAKTGEREYVFGQGGGDKLAEELQVPLLGRIPLKQPDWDNKRPGRVDPGPFFIQLFFQ